MSNMKFFSTFVITLTQQEAYRPSERWERILSFVIRMATGGLRQAAPLRDRVVGCKIHLQTPPIAGKKLHLHDTMDLNFVFQYHVHVLNILMFSVDRCVIVNVHSKLKHTLDS